MPNVYFIGLFAIMGVVALGGSYLKGRSDGGKIVTSEYAKRDVKAAEDYAAKTKTLTDQYRAKEQAQGIALAAVSKDYQGKINANTKYYLSELAKHPRLRDPGTVGAACGDSAASTAASTSGRDGAQGAELSEKLTGFLVAEASRADAVVLQLGACQDVLEKERQ